MALALAAIIGGGIWWQTRSSASGEESSDPVEQTVEVTSGTLSRTVATSGTIEAAETEQLSFAAAGTVTAVNVEAGDEVSADDVLATIDSAALGADVSEAEATVAEAEAQLETEQDAGASDAQIAAAESSLASAQAQLDATREALAGAELVAGIDGTVSSVDLTVGQELGDGGTSGSQLTGSGTGSGRSSGTLDSSESGQAPPSAGSGSTTEEPDSSTTSTETQIEVVSTGSYVVGLALDDTEIDQVEVGQTATIRPSDSASAGGPSGFPGRAGAGGQGGGQDDATSSDDEADESDPDGEQATGLVTSVGTIADASSGVATYPVEVAFEASPDDFHVGATADVDIVYDEVADATQVLTQAVSTADGVSTVVVVTDAGREERTVETGVNSGGMVQITSGLEVGEQVVVSLGSGPGGDGSNGGPGGGGQSTPPGGSEPGGGFPGGGGGFPGGGPGGGAGG